jgi:hypothetical protein
MESPVEHDEFDPPANVLLFLESFHQFRLSFDDMVESFKHIVVRTHPGIIEVRDDKVKVLLD